VKLKRRNVDIVTGLGRRSEMDQVLKSRDFLDRWSL
jgi:hypothetical protein